MATYDRHKIVVGSKLEVRTVRSGVDKKGLPYWKFYTPYTMRINGNPVVYKHLWCVVYGRMYPFAEGDWVVVTRILEHRANCRPNDDGGMQVFEDLVVEVEKVVKERDYVET